MNIVGLITEYNPFHNGHKYHLEQSKRISNCDYSICIMSGNFTQRGEPAIMDKFQRAKIAVDNGVDLVIELPVIHSLRSAEGFAYGAISLLNSMNVVQSVSFGSESGNINKLSKIADILTNEPLEYKHILKEHLNQGQSYPKARSNALNTYISKYTDYIINDLEDILSSSNNILGIEYLKAINKLSSNILPYTYSRVGSDYKDIQLKGKLSSATSIRKALKSGDFESISDSIPTKTLDGLTSYYSKYKSFNFLDKYNDILIYLLRTNKSLYDNDILDVEKGLNDRLHQMSMKYNDINSVIENTKTKRYTYTRIQRILMHILLNMKKDFVTCSVLDQPSYFRVLAMNTNGQKILRSIKRNSQVPIITKFTDFKKLFSMDSQQHNLLALEKKATDIYFMPFKEKPLTNLEYTTTPYVKKL